MIPATDFISLNRPAIKSASSPKLSPVPTTTTPPQISNRHPNLGLQWNPVKGMVQAVPPWLSQTVHGAVPGASPLPQPLSNIPVVARAGFLAETSVIKGKSADDALMIWISGRGKKSPVQATTDALTSDQPAPQGTTNPGDIDLQAILDEWKLTNQLDMQKIRLYAVMGGSYPSRVAGLMKMLDVVDKVLDESELSRVHLIEAQFDELTKGTFNYVLRATRISTAKPENEALRRSVLSRFRHMLHHHPILINSFKSYCANHTIRSAISNCGLTSSIKALEHLRDSGMRISDNELDDLFGSSSDAPPGWPHILRAIQTRVLSSGSGQTHRPVPSSQVASSDAGSCTTSTSTSGDTRSSRQHAKKRQQSELAPEENGARAKRHRAEHAGGFTLPESEPYRTHPPDALPFASNHLRHGLAASLGSMNAADIGEAPSSDLNEIVKWLSPSHFESSSSSQQADDGAATKFNNSQTMKSPQENDDSFWEKFFKEPYW